MHPKKSPTSDGGMLFLFYQHYWSLVSDCVTHSFLDFLNHDFVPPNFNETHVVLIPKIKYPTKITQYRPISLSNVVLRLASKVLENRLKCLFLHVISENQSAFISERLITDNVVVAFETMHHINQKKLGKTGEMAVKLDMSKAYNRVEWDCLKKLMGKMGFHEKWVNIMMRCIRFVSYSIKINRMPHGHMTPTWDLRQGDPLSTYLFLIWVEGLSVLLKKTIEEGEMKGVVACHRGPKISHLFFADNSLIYC